MTRTIVLLPIAAAGLIIAGVVIALWMAGSASGERDKFSSLEIAPAEADIFFALNTDPTSPQWLAVNDSLGDINAKDPIREAIDAALAEVNLDWEEDILPVAGDEAFLSIPDIERFTEGDDSTGGGVVAGFRIRNQDKAQEVFDDLRDRAANEGDDFQEEEYEGVTIYFTEAPEIDTDEPIGNDDEDEDSDDDPPILDPFDDTFFECIEYSFDFDEREDPIPTECQPYFECPLFGLNLDADDTDSDGDGIPDTCEEFDFFSEDASFEIFPGDEGSFEIFPDDLDDGQAVPIRIEDNGDDAAGGFTQETPVPDSGAVALFDNVLALGASPDDVKAVIDVVQGRADSAETNERLQEFRELQDEDFLIWGYADLAPVWDLLEEGIATEIGGSGGDEGIIPREPEPTPRPSQTEAPDADFAVTSFDAHYQFDEGELLVTERINVDFGATPKHGMFRDIPTLFEYDSENDEFVLVTPVSVQRDGADEPFEANETFDTMRIKVGDPEVTIEGQHEYVVQYRLSGGIHDHSDEPLFDIRWDAIGSHWSVPIENVSLTVEVLEGHQILAATCEDGPLSCVDSTLTRATIQATNVQPGQGLIFSVAVNGESGAPEPALLPKFALEEGLDDEHGEEGSFDPPFDPEQFMDDLRGLADRAGFSISSHESGFSLDLTVLQSPDYVAEYEWEPGQPFESGFADRVPADTMFFFAAGPAYQQSYSQLQEQFNSLDEEQQEAWEEIQANFFDETGLDLEEDILALLTGEVAFAGNISGFDQESPEFELIAIADVEDGAHAEESFRKAGEYLEDQGVIEVQDENRWTLFDLGEAVTWKIEENVAYIGYPEEAVDSAASGEDDSLADSGDWKRTMDLLPDDGVMVGFLSLARILEEAQASPDAEAEFLASTDGEISLEDLEPIRSVGFSSTIRENGFGYHVVLFMED